MEKLGRHAPRECEVVSSFFVRPILRDAREARSSEAVNLCGGFALRLVGERDWVVWSDLRGGDVRRRAVSRSSEPDEGARI